MEEYVDSYLAENSALHRKLKSKAEALLILNQELDQCRAERDQFRLMAEQVQNRYALLKKKSVDTISSGRISDIALPTSSSAVQLLAESKEQNKLLQFEVQNLKQKLKEAYGDIQVLRAGLKTAEKVNRPESLPAHQREKLIQELEILGNKCHVLESDLQCLLDEKEELIVERDAYRCKVHRLNYQLNTALNGDVNKVIDIDSLVMDNKYLKERLDQVMLEKELAQQSLAKYKSMLEKKRINGSLKFGSNAAGKIVSHKQVQELLEKTMPNTETTVADMKSLCLAVLEALQDKSLALSHQKKANKILASRISELEQRLDSSPSQALLEGYSSALVDKDLENILKEDKEISELLTKESSPTSNSTNGECIDCNEYDEDQDLPTDLRELIQQALKEIKEESRTNN